MFKRKKSKEKKDKKRIMLVCGSGMVSSTLVYPMVEEILKEGGFRYEIIKGGFNDIKKYANINMILTTVSPLPKNVVEMGIPVVVVTSLFKGDKESVRDNIYEVLKK
ncbi:PTS sugar transporter subunit IIB [Maledivibacter halophilus]|uniref:Phosphotransferase system, galactitol-specific IIB component n=1 Tax=Maledivibacter halophilus TaxID=36842 RepID=A0A1T5MIN9_9FIRM|nr:hypothetical protein [Maledivibacter halophilus]SKC88072.1 Phosphotransferase system, galactitol-specific IIB component [Maledivibacter halophilus]